ncbi:hypothetical protein DL98DRAFT_607120 [Cadophora sp. DSE1049]|nr:hypothetical protein DL98DRAFT_607120 [Cadophora sp. DSE1049]
MALFSTIKAYIRKLFARKDGKKKSGSSSQLVFPVLPHEDPTYVPKPIGVFTTGSKEPDLEVLLDEDEGKGDFFSDGEEGAAKEVAILSGKVTCDPWNYSTQAIPGNQKAPETPLQCTPWISGHMGVKFVVHVFLYAALHASRTHNSRRIPISTNQPQQQYQN